MLLPLNGTRCVVSAVDCVPCIKLNLDLQDTRTIFETKLSHARDKAVCRFPLLLLLLFDVVAADLSFVCAQAAAADKLRAAVATRDEAARQRDDLSTQLESAMSKLSTAETRVAAVESAARDREVCCLIVCSCLMFRGALFRILSCFGLSRPLWIVRPLGWSC